MATTGEPPTCFAVFKCPVFGTVGRPDLHHDVLYTVARPEDTSQLKAACLNPISAEYWSNNY
jgi:hypothetical protein